MLSRFNRDSTNTAVGDYDEVTISNGYAGRLIITDSTTASYFNNFNSIIIKADNVIPDKMPYCMEPYEYHKYRIIKKYPYAYYVFKAYDQMIKDRFYRSGEQRKSILRPDYRFLMLRVRDVFKKQGRGG